MRGSRCYGPIGFGTTDKLRRLAIGVSLCFGASLVGVSTTQAQTADAKIRDSRSELQKIRKEREALEKRMKTLQVSSRNVADELENVSRQHNATLRAVKSLDKQLVNINDAVKETSLSLSEAEAEAVEKRNVLQRRMVDIYKRGPLFDIEALFSAKSFGALIARYKYLHELAVSDKRLLQRVEELREKIRNRRLKLVDLQGDLTQSKSEKEKEENRLKTLEKAKQSNLKKLKADAAKTKKRMQQLAKAEARINTVISRLEAERKKGTASAAARGPSSIKTSDLGNLAWPVNGSVLYNFGRSQTPNGTVIRWNGIGIEAPVGTAVKAVASGEVRVAEGMGGYGKTVIIEHGGGDYSVYGSLNSISVKVGTKVSKGQTIGTVGQSDPDQPPHLHFEIRRKGPAVDPATWLRNAK